MWGSAPRPRKPCKGLVKTLTKNISGVFLLAQVFFFLKRKSMRTPPRSPVVLVLMSALMSALPLLSPLLPYPYAHLRHRLYHADHTLCINLTMIGREFWRKKKSISSAIFYFLLSSSHKIPISTKRFGSFRVNSSLSKYSVSSLVTRSFLNPHSGR